MNRTPSIPDLAMKLRVLRHRAGLKQGQLAIKTGIGWRSISAFESGRHFDLTLAQAVALTSACGITVNDLLAIEPTADEVINIELGRLGRRPAPEPVSAFAHRRVDPLARFLTSDLSPYPSPVSSLGGLV